jgi:hypothetical protein
MAQELTLAELLAEVTWHDLMADGVITPEDIEAELEGFPPNSTDHLPE